MTVRATVRISYLQRVAGNSDSNGVLGQSTTITELRNGRQNWVSEYDNRRFDWYRKTGHDNCLLEDVPIVASYSIVSKPASGEHRIKALRIDALGRIVVVYDGTPEP